MKTWGVIIVSIDRRQRHFNSPGEEGSDAVQNRSERLAMPTPVGIDWFS